LRFIQEFISMGNIYILIILQFQVAMYFVFCLLITAEMAGLFQPFL